MLDTITNDEINERLASICDESVRYAYEAFGGKALPYLGWYWRPVAFDRDDCMLGVVCEDGKRRVGFDESGRDFDQVDYVRLTGDEWRAMKHLVIETALHPSTKSLRALNEAIQALDPGKTT